MAKKNTYTPMMQHYLEIKQQHQDAIIFYRLGDFYEMFFEDAKTASQELDLVLTGRNAGVEEKVPMCGIPFHASKGYIQRLIQKGYKVAIVEQLENPAEAKGLVKRDIIKIVTPGTIMDEVNDEKNTDKNGVVQFSNLNLGLYLVSQKERDDIKYYSEPFLISIPMIEDSNEIFNIYSKPKFIEKNENEIPVFPNVPDSSVGTGDNTNITLWIVLLLVSGSGILSAKRKKLNNFN